MLSAAASAAVPEVRPNTPVPSGTLHTKIAPAVPTPTTKLSPQCKRSTAEPQQRRRRCCARDTRPRAGPHPLLMLPHWPQPPSISMFMLVSQSMHRVLATSLSSRGWKKFRNSGEPEANMPTPAANRVTKRNAATTRPERPAATGWTSTAKGTKYSPRIFRCGGATQLRE